MPYFKMSNESVVEIIRDQAKNLDAADKANILQMLLSSNRNEVSRYIVCPISINKFINVDIDTVLYVSQPQRKNATIHLMTGEEIVYCVEVDLMEYIKEHFANFECLDQAAGTIVNMNLVKYYNSYMNHVYFTKEHFIQVTGSAMRNIVSKFFKGRELEYDLFLKKGEDKKGVYAPIGLRFGRKLT